MDVPNKSNSETRAPGARNDLAPEIVVERRPPRGLKPSPHQVREVKKTHVGRICTSIRNLGFSVPVLIRGDEIVDGHARVAAAGVLGLETIPCIDVSHLNEHETRLLRLALNRTQEQGTWDEQALKLEFACHLEFANDLTITGFPAWEIDQVLEIGSADADVEELDDSGELPAPEADAVSLLGDLWRLGDHLLLCGNARHVDHLDKLIGARPVALLLSDPPFNQPIAGHVTSNPKHPEFYEASGEMSRKEFEAFLTTTFGNAASYLRKGGLAYVFMDWRGLEPMYRALRSIGLEHIQQAIWVKSHPGRGSFYRSAHEQVFIARKPGAQHRNNIELGSHGRNRSNVWQFPGATGGSRDEADDFKSHPTSKPLKLIEEAIIDVTAAGEWVLDPFLGSGSTLLAAERTRRRCLGLEVSPAYVDLSVRRWQAMTGEPALLVNTGQTFVDLSEERSGPKPECEEGA